MEEKHIGQVTHFAATQKNRLDQLTKNPALGHPGRLDGTRELVAPDTRYIVPYRVMLRLNRGEILRVFHTPRKLPESRS